MISPLKVIIVLLTHGAAFFWKLGLGAVKVLVYEANFLKSKQNRQVMIAISLSFVVALPACSDRILPI